MKSALVGYTGFVGSNLAEQFEFTLKFNTKNIAQAFGTTPDLLVYAGVRAEKFIANREPEQDMLLIREAAENIKKINPKMVVLISTIDVYQKTIGADESTKIETEGLQPYGANRYFLEKSVREEFPSALIIRLPALYGKNIKKNFIYDFIHIIPSLLTYEKISELWDPEGLLKKYYKLKDNGFYKCIISTDNDRKQLKTFFENSGFSALNFTDSRGCFQFYPLSRLWHDIIIALKNDIKVINLATEPVVISELYRYLTGATFENHLNQVIPDYNFKTMYASIYGGRDGYVYNKQYILNDIKSFIKEQM